mmetsp:Transcript_30288/g.69698  ORF Transcript_30288/g.69698 Transcript_30288/m.69698 type:complete len:194 (+) Transcript_30288:47-628(+)
MASGSHGHDAGANGAQMEISQELFQCLQHMVRRRLYHKSPAWRLWRTPPYRPAKLQIVPVPSAKKHHISHCPREVQVFLYARDREKGFSRSVTPHMMDLCEEVRQKLNALKAECREMTYDEVQLELQRLRKEFVKRPPRAVHGDEAPALDMTDPDAVAPLGDHPEATADDAGPPKKKRKKIAGGSMAAGEPES